MVSRLLGPAEYGKIALFSLALLVITQLAHAGVGSAAIQFGAEFAARSEREAVRRLVARSTGWHVLVQAPLAVVTAFVLLQDAAWELRAVAALSVVVPCALSGGALALTMLSKTHRAAQIALPNAFLAGAAAVAVASATRDGATVWVASLVVSASIVPLTFLALGQRDRRLAAGMAIPRGMPTGFWPYAARAGAASLLTLLVSARSEIFILQVKASPADVGLFALAFGVAAQLTAPVDALTGPLLPAAAGLFAAQRDTFARALKRALRFASLGAGFLIAVAVPVLTLAFTDLYGPRYAGASAAFLPLAISSCMATCLAPMSTFASAGRMPGALLRANIAALILDAAAGFLLVGYFGIAGAVIANCATSFLFLALVARSQAHLMSGVEILSAVESAALGCLAMAAALGAVELAVPNSLTVRILGSAAIGAVVYYATLRQRNQLLDPEEFNALSVGAPRPVRWFVARAQRLLVSVP